MAKKKVAPETILAPEIPSIASTVLAVANDVWIERTNLVKTEVERIVADYLAAGGCKDCYGTHSVITWSTLDGPSWTEFGPCQTCECKSPSCPGAVHPSGYESAHVSRQQLPRTHFVNGAWSYHASVCTDVRDRVELLDKYESILKQWTTFVTDIRKVWSGREVVVKSGRKVKSGTVAAVLWAGETQWGNRARIRVNGSNEDVWVDLRHLEVSSAYVDRTLLSSAIDNQFALTPELLAALSQYEAGRMFLVKLDEAQEKHPRHV